MAYEIDYIPVSDGERSGDAIALRFGNLHGGPRDQQLVVVRRWLSRFRKGTS